jgi:hypothetical protein
MIKNIIDWIYALFLSIMLSFTGPAATATPNAFELALNTPEATVVAEATMTSSPSPIPVTTIKPIVTTPLPTVRPTAVPPVVNNVPPGSGYSRQSVRTDIGVYTVSIVAADMGSTRVIVDTASQSDCASNCPALSLADYVTRNGGYAGVNGTYFCPRDYPSCAGKENSFDLLVMNKDKYYFNSGNNVYSSNPAAIFGSGYVRFVTSGSQWGRDTSVDGVIMNYPLLVFNGSVVFQGDGDPKKGAKGSRSFVANKGSTIYIGVSQNVTVAENALVLKAMGMDNALNLDSGGSTALWSGGYKVGPGRAIPNAIVFKQK